MGKSKKHRPKSADAKPISSFDLQADTPAAAKQAPTETKSENSTVPQPGQDFESYYLQRVTAEFADDLDKVRNAGDFKSSSIPVLVRALKQGATGFSDEEKRNVMNPST